MKTPPTTPTSTTTPVPPLQHLGTTPGVTRPYDGGGIIIRRPRCPCCGSLTIYVYKSRGDTRYYRCHDPKCNQTFKATLI